MSIVGHWIHISSENWEYYHIGEIIAMEQSHYLVKIRHDEGPHTMRLYSIDQLSKDESFLFATEQDLNAWMNWLDEPSKSKEFKLMNFKPSKDPN